MNAVRIVLLVAFVLVCFFLVLFVLFQDDGQSGMGGLLGGRGSAAFGSHSASFLRLCFRLHCSIESRAFSKIWHRCKSQIQMLQKKVNLVHGGKRVLERQRVRQNLVQKHFQTMLK